MSMHLKFVLLFSIAGCTAVEPAVHRSAPVECDDARPAGVPTGSPDDCAADQDCTAGRNGRCLTNRDYNFCTYDECVSDGDCGADSVCECGGGFAGDHNVCLPGNCATDADCGSDYCSPSFGSCGFYDGTVGYFCHTKDDECVDDADCDMDRSEYCAFDQGSGHWSFSDAGCDG